MPLSRRLSPQRELPYVRGLRKLALSVALDLDAANPDPEDDWDRQVLKDLKRLRRLFMGMGLYPTESVLSRARARAERAAKKQRGVRASCDVQPSLPS